MRRLGFVVVSVALAAAACQPPKSPPPPPPPGPRPLGTLVLTAEQDSTCPAGHSCQGFVVRCPSVSHDATGFLGVLPPDGTPRGVVMLFGGGAGRGWWSESSDLGGPFVEGLRSDGFVVVQTSWETGWSAAAPGEQTDPAVLACRPATVVDWVHAHHWTPGDPVGPVGRCGFCVTGNSGGASQVSYALSHYGLEPILDAVIPTSGPPHAALDKGCLRRPGEEAYWYSPDSARTIDSSYGFYGGGGPCETHDPAFTARWLGGAVDTGGDDYVHPATRVHFIFGGLDGGNAPDLGRDYRARLEAAGSPLVSEVEVPTMPHSVQASPDGLAALRDAILAGD